MGWCRSACRRQSTLADNRIVFGLAVADDVFHLLRLLSCFYNTDEAAASICSQPA